MTRQRWKVELSADARDDISRDFPYGTGVEAAGLLFGRIVEGPRIIIDTVFPTRDEGATSGRVAPDWDAALMLDRPERRVVGDVHSHEYYIDEPRARASDADVTHWREIADRLHQPVVGMIIHPRSQYWDAGCPANDWVNPRINAWVAEPNDLVLPAELVIQPRWLGELEAGLRFRESVAHHHGL